MASNRTPTSDTTTEPSTLDDQSGKNRQQQSDIPLTDVPQFDQETTTDAMIKNK